MMRFRFSRKANRGIDEVPKGPRDGLFPAYATGNSAPVIRIATGEEPDDREDPS